ncbi:MAG: hypothetical protein SPJ89_09410 [Treponema sp.]|nr:hypothetical protein [Spirochaetales bacterium]MDY5812181.1 hypothetical protein [Treponema sp.]
MSYLLNKEPTDDFTRKLDGLVNTIKSNKQFRKGYDSMGAVWYMDAKREGKLEGISIGKQQGISIGAFQKAMEDAKNFLSMGLSIEQIAKGTGLSITEVQKLAGK